MYRARYVPSVLEGRALLAVVCHGALRVVRANCLKSPSPGVRVRTGRITIRKQTKSESGVLIDVSCEGSTLGMPH